MQACVCGEQTRTHLRGGMAQRRAFQLQRRRRSVSENPDLLRLHVLETADRRSAPTLTQEPHKCSLSSPEGPGRGRFSFIAPICKMMEAKKKKKTALQSHASWSLERRRVSDHVITPENTWLPCGNYIHRNAAEETRRTDGSQQIRGGGG